MAFYTLALLLLGYLLLWGIELTKVWFKLPGRFAVLVAGAAVVVAAHGLHLYARIQSVHELAGRWALPATFYDWTMTASFGLALVYFALTLRRRESVIGIFVVPLILAMVLGGISVRGNQPFERGGDATAVWAYVHGGGLAAAAISVSLGLAVSILRLWQQRRLKAKRSLGGPLRLPSLEYLDDFGRSCLLASTAGVATGLTGGVVMNVFGVRGFSWTDPGILLSGCLLIWMVVALLIELRATRGGGSRTVALNMISFVVTASAMLFVVSNAHGRGSVAAAGRPVEPEAAAQQPQEAAAPASKSEAVREASTARNRGGATA